MKFKEVKKIMAVAMAVSTLTPSAVYAAEPVNPVEVQESTAEETQEQTQEMIPEAMPEENIETVPETESTPEALPDIEPEETPEVTPTPEATPDENADNNAGENTEETVPESEVPQELPETPEMPESGLPEASPEEVPETPELETPSPETPSTETAPEEVTDNVTEAVPEMVPEDTQIPSKETSNHSTSVSQQSAVSLKGETKKARRFFTVARRYAFAKGNIELKEEMKEDSRSIATLADKGVCFLLKEEGDWYFVESGEVRGFLPKAAVVTGDEANLILKEYKADQDYKDSIEEVAPVAQETVPAEENKAYFYTMGTTRQTVVEKVYTISTASVLNVREGKGTDSQIIGQLPNGTLCYILADQESDWVYIESGDVRGFVSKQYIRFGEDVDKEVKEHGEDAYKKAVQKVKPEENKAFYYTHTSVKTDAPTSKIREEIVEYASQFIGNPYVWGGTDPVKGADCSGFVQTIYRTYGIELPRVAEAQAYAGEQIPVSEAQPGDLIFYMDKTGYIHHVVMYAGDGKTVEAKGRAYGIVSDDVSSTACWAVRLLEEEPEEVVSSSDIHEVNATEDMYGDSLGEYDITYYCACEKCCDVETGLTATGTQVAEGRTIAVDPSVIPYGTQVIIGGHVFTAEDCGGAIKKNRIDIYVNSHEKALELGRNKAEVFLLK